MKAKQFALLMAALIALILLLASLQGNSQTLKIKVKVDSVATCISPEGKMTYVYLSSGEKQYTYITKWRKRDKWKGNYILFYSTSCDDGYAKAYLRRPYQMVTLY